MKNKEIKFEDIWNDKKRKDVKQAIFIALL